MAEEQESEPGGLVVLTLFSLLVGVLVGLVGAAFRTSLDAADRLRALVIAWAHEAPLPGFLALVAACAGATLLAAWLVKQFARHASGSGIPHVEAVLHDGLPPAPYGLALVKFAGGVLSIGAGLALGREGPTVQMGASLAVAVGRVSRLPWADCRTLLAAGAGAGLATAFNAPLAGAAFVLEELVRRFETRTTIAALAASASAIGVSRMLLGDASDFQVAALAPVPFEARLLFLALGAAMGLAGVAYNKTLLATLALAARAPVAARAALIGAAVGALAFAYPGLVGGGDVVVQKALLGGQGLQLAALALLVRFVLSPVSYAADTPGGIFAPLLAIGALFGVLYGMACRWLWPGLDIPDASFAIVSMASFFVGVVRSPLTGMVLVSEMTGNVTLLLPMLGACAFAMAVPTLLGDPPIYDSLKASLLRRERLAGRSGRLPAGPG